MKLIVGLGNPGIKYKKTRHNVGFMAIDCYAKKYNLSFKTKFKGLLSEHIINNEKVILVKPQTYMNLSGECVLSYAKYYNVDVKDILIIYDDVDFEVGTFKVKRGGSSNGHNGIKDIINKLKTEDINRIRIGISKNQIPLMDYVLQKFTKEEIEKVNSILPNICDVIDDFEKYDIDKLMNKYNGLNNE